MAANGADGSITIDTSLDTKGFLKGSQELLNAVRGLTDAFNKLGESLQASLGKATQQAPQTSGNDVSALQGKVKSLEDEVARLNKELSEMQTRTKGAGSAASSAAKSTEDATDSIAKLQDIGTDITDIANALKVMAQAGSKGVAGDRGAWKTYRKILPIIQQGLADVRAKIADLEAVGDPLNAEALATATQSVNAMEQQFEALQQTVGQLRHEQSVVKWGHRIGAAIRGTVLAPVRAARLGFRGMQTALRGVASIGKRAASALQSFGRRAQSSNKSVLGGIGTILKYALSISSVMAVLTKIKSFAKEGIGNLAQVYAPLNTAISSMMSALTRLKNSLGSAFNPIITAVAPAITTLINMLSDAITYIGMFIAALTGAKTYQKAIGVQEDYAASLNSTASAAGSAADALKEEKRQLAGFDQLNILSGPDSSGSGSSGGSGGGGKAGKADPSGMFETVGIPSAITDYIAEIKRQFAEGDYTGIGESIATGLNTAVARVNELVQWDKVKEPVTTTISAICGAFNGLVGGVNWQLIGSTFGAGANIIINAASQIFNGVDWSGVGSAIATGLNGAISEIDWELLGRTLGDKFAAKLSLITSAVGTFDWATAGSKLGVGINSLVQRIQTALDSTDWESLGSNFATGINTLIGTVNWTSIGSTLGSKANAVIGTIKGAVTTFDWAAAGLALAQSVNGFFAKVDWATLGTTFSDSVKGVLTSINTAIEEIDWQAIGEDIYTFLTNIDWSGIASGLMEGTGAVLGGLAGAIAGLFNNALANISQYFDDSTDKAGGDIVAGILYGIGQAILNIGIWIKENVFDPFVTGLLNAFGIHSPADTMKEPGENIANGILEGILNIFSNIATWVKDNIFTPISNAVAKAGEIIGVGVGLVKQGWTTVTGWISGAAANIGGALNKAVGLAKNGWNTVAGWVTTAAGSVVQKSVALAKNGWTTVSNWVGGVKDNIGGAVTKAIGLVKSGWSTVSNWVGGVKDNIGGAVTKAIGLVKSGWSTVAGWVTTAAGSVVQKSVGLAKNGWDTVASWITGAKDRIGDAVNKFIGLEKQGWTNIANWVDGFTGGAVSKAVALAKNGWEKVSNWVTNNTNWGNTVSKAIELAKNGWSKVSSWVTNKDNWGAAVSKAIDLLRNGWTTVTQWINDNFFGSGSIEVPVKMKQGGGGASYGGNFASGGVIRGGTRRFWHSIPQYASGTRRAHGSLFLAGEAGPEIIGHVGGRTEILNKSQLAATMHAAIVAGMATPINALGSAIISRMALGANALISAIVAPDPQAAALTQAVAELAGTVEYVAPVMSAGTVLPYSVTHGATGTEAITDAISISNDQLSDVLVRAIASAAGMVAQAIRDKDMDVTVDAGSFTQRTINEINRRTVMFQTSPLKA